MTRESSGRDTIWYVYCQLDVRYVYASTGRTNVAMMGVPSLGLTNGDVGLLMGVDCDILTQDLIRLIEYSYHQVIPSFSKAHLQRTPGLSVLGPEQF
jgi:hypothetical protein